MKHLHSYWRMEYIQAPKKPKESENPFAHLPQNLDDSAVHIIHRGKSIYIVLNKFPYNPGHLLVVPYREVSRPVDLTEVERSELMENLIFGQTVLEEAFNPDGFNIGFNIGSAGGAGIPKHLHAHIVPRWEGDTNFMPVLGETRVLPESMDRMWKKLHTTASRIKEGP
jgi:ATP adenylyltransferase